MDFRSRINEYTIAKGYVPRDVINWFIGENRANVKVTIFVRKRY